MIISPTVVIGLAKPPPPPAEKERLPLLSIPTTPAPLPAHAGTLITPAPEISILIALFVDNVKGTLVVVPIATPELLAPSENRYVLSALVTPNVLHAAAEPYVPAKP
jgi:hypothetical protein